MMQAAFRMEPLTMMKHHLNATDVAELEAVPDVTPARRFERTRWPRPTTGVTCVIPAVNEGRNIEWVLRRLPDVVDEVILIDGESTDDTVAISVAARPDIRVINQARRGKGAALRAGFEAARGDTIVMIDADCSMDPAEIPLFLACLDEGFDMVKGSRFMEGAGTTDMERIRRWGNGVLRDITNVLYRADFTDLCYGYIAFRRNVLERLQLRTDGFEIETEIIVRALKTGLRVAEVPSFEAPRAHGESNLRTWRDGSRVATTLLRHRVQRLVPAEPALARASLQPQQGEHCG